MSKLLLLLICVSIVLFTSLQLRVSNNLQFNADYHLSLASSKERRRLSYGLQGWKYFSPANDPRTIDMKDQNFVNFQQQEQQQQDGANTNINFQQSTIVNFEDDNMFNYGKMNVNNSNKNMNTIRDENIVAMNNNDASSNPGMEPLHVCGRKAPIPHELYLQIMQKYERCPLLSRPPEKTTILLMEGVETFGRTGNNLIEFMHALQYGKDNGVLVAITSGSWPTHLITNMWMAIRANTDDDRAIWRDTVERAFCVKMLEHSDEAEQYQEVIRMETRDLFVYKHEGPLNPYVEYQGTIMRSLWRAYNDGTGINMRKQQVKNMCSVLDALFGDEKQSAIYSVIHSRSLEGDPGLRLLGRIAKNVDCDPVAALTMEPEYVKAILEPLGMLNYPIVFLTDHQQPEILERLLADPDIGPNLHMVPDEASWVGGDVAAAVMADVFIGNPASTFSGFIAKSRVALGYDTNFLFRKQNKTTGEWADVCDARCIFEIKVMNAMA